MKFRIAGADGIKDVEREPNDPIICKCGSHFFDTGERGLDEYYPGVPELWVCDHCKGSITVTPMGW